MCANSSEKLNPVAPTNERRVVADADFPLAIPTDIAVCPICGAALVVEEILCWDPETGEIFENEVSFGCVTEPPIDSKEWWPWHRWHYRMPYVYWLPLEDVVVRWFNANYAYRTVGTVVKQGGW